VKTPAHNSNDNNNCTTITTETNTAFIYVQKIVGSNAEANSHPFLSAIPSSAFYFLF
jgi:hypothetical protein